MARNLKHLHIQKEIQVATLLPFKEEWHRSAATYKPSPAAFLQSITMSTLHECLLNIAEKFDILLLRSLDLDQYHDTAVLTQISRSFPSLERLFISVDPMDWRELDIYAHIMMLYAP
ncbi:hypothetical protein BDW72DRAFT_174523 [Aspergillus terricola var. indicus]